jgi:hypothetical protein
MTDKYYQDILDGLRERDEEHRPMSKEEAFAVYGYIAAFFEMGHLTMDQVRDLQDRLPLTVEDRRKIETLP